MIHSFRLYDLFVLGFVQLIVSFLLVLSPLRDIDMRFQWTGSRGTEVFLGAVGAVSVTALSCVIAAQLWGLPATGVATAGYLLVVFAIAVIIARPECSVIAKVFYASYAAAGFTFLAFAALVAAAATHSLVETLTSSLLIVLDLGAFLVWNSNVNYVSDVLGRTRRARPLPQADPDYRPMVSIHMPAYNEPPEMLIESIKHVENIDYPNFEIVVIDNNTADPAVFGPVEQYCQGKERVKFVHVSPWPGYKSGACNLALRSHTDPRAEVIGVVDADDIVQPHYLKETAPYFSDPRLGFVQTFEGNRDYEGSKYYTACVDSFKGFYLAIMSSRNERDSVPFVGTMGLFRRSALEGIGGWNEWCISEDTEASLRVLKAGWSGLYVPRCFGRGIVAPTYAALNTQRHRWCFGAMQILRLHWRSLMPWDRSPDNHLTTAQRRDYLMGCVGWFRDLLMVGFSLLLLVVTGLVLGGSTFALTPLGGDRSLLPVSLIVIATLGMTFTLRYWTPITLRRAFLGVVVSLSAGWITALACIQGLTYREGVFLRTAKAGPGRQRHRRALRTTWAETLLSLALFTSAGLLAARSHPPILLIVIIAVQGSVFLCAPIAALWNVRAQRVPRAEYRRRFEEQRVRQAVRPRRTFATAAFAGAMVVAVLTGAAVAVFAGPGRLVPVPARTIGPIHMASDAPAPSRTTVTTAGP